MIDERTIHRLGGIASARQLRAAGAFSEELSAAVGAGRLRRLRKGYYAVPGAPPAAVSAVLARGRLSCVSAARSYGLWGGSDQRLHLQYSSHARAGPTGVPDPHVRHWLPTEPSTEVWRVTVADCLRSVARCADEETAVAVFDTALSAGLVTLRQLRGILAGQPANVRRRWSLARPGSDSGVESIVRQRLQARGHVVEQQVHVEGVGRVDMRIDGELFMEVDGFAYHADRGAFERDRLRDARLGARGSPPLRVSAAQVLHEWPVVLDALERRLTHSANSQEGRDQPGAVGCFIH
jgi:very-short-patch-repair endonuclease